MDLTKQLNIFLLQYKRDAKELSKKNMIAATTHLRINKRKYGPQYYERDEENARYGKYIKRADIAKAALIAQKDYNLEALNYINEQTSLIENFLEQFDETGLDCIYQNLSDERKALIRPIRPDKQAYIEEWLAKEYQKFEIDDGVAAFKTKKGDFVRSKSEKIIADYLFDHKIPYRYEYKLVLRDSSVVRPDFTILDVRDFREIILEHLGLMDRPEYVKKNLKKIRLYEANGYYPGKNLILTFETDDLPLDIDLLDKLLRTYLQY